MCALLCACAPKAAPPTFVAAGLLLFVFVSGKRYGVHLPPLPSSVVGRCPCFGPADDNTAVSCIRPHSSVYLPQCPLKSTSMVEFCRWILQLPLCHLRARPTHLVWACSLGPSNMPAALGVLFSSPPSRVEHALRYHFHRSVRLASLLICRGQEASRHPREQGAWRARF